MFTLPHNTIAYLYVYLYHFHALSYSEANRHDIEKGMNHIKKRVWLGRQMRITYSDEEIQELIRTHIPEGTKQSGEGEPAIFLCPSIYFTKNTVLPYEAIYPLKKMEFEGTEYNVPNHAREYLSFMYGDYMSYPPKVAYQHAHMEEIVKRMPFENAVNRFLDKYGN